MIKNILYYIYLKIIKKNKDIDMVLHPWEEKHWLPGILSHTQLVDLQKSGYIKNFDISTSENNPDGDDWHESAIDLRLSDECYKMKIGSIKPFGKTAYRRILNDTEVSEKFNKTGDYYELKKGNVYVFKLIEELTAKLKNIYGQATAKSTIGRLDVIARLIIDGEYQYECFDSKNLSDSNGEMYLEVIPISFNIKVKENDKLTQLRVFYGKIEDSVITDESFLQCILINSNDGSGYLSVDTSKLKIKNKDASAFKAKKDNEKFISIDVKDIDPDSFWDIVSSDEKNRLKILNNEFYIIRSKERISLPSGVAVYCRAIDESLGEMRIHYAGFVLPYFGLERNDDKKGTPLIFEVRGHNVDVVLADGERLAKLTFYRMSQQDQWNTNKKPIYSDQELDLSKLFRKMSS